MVVSRACIIVAVMAQIVTMFRRRPGAASGGRGGVGRRSRHGLVVVRRRRREAEQGGERTAMAGVDRSIGAHPGLQLLDVFVMAVEVDLHPHALYELSEIAT